MKELLCDGCPLAIPFCKGRCGYSSCARCSNTLLSHNIILHLLWFVFVLHKPVCWLMCAVQKKNIHTSTQSILCAKSSRSPEKTEEYRGEDGADLFEAQESTDVPKLSADCKEMILAGLMGDRSKPIMPHLFEGSWTWWTSMHLFLIYINIYNYIISHYPRPPWIVSVLTSRIVQRRQWLTPRGSIDISQRPHNGLGIFKSCSVEHHLKMMLFMLWTWQLYAMVWLKICSWHGFYPHFVQVFFADLFQQNPFQ